MFDNKTTEQLQEELRKLEEAKDYNGNCIRTSPSYAKDMFRGIYAQLERKILDLKLEIKDRLAAQTKRNGRLKSGGRPTLFVEAAKKILDDKTISKIWSEVNNLERKL